MNVSEQPARPPHYQRHHWWLERPDRVAGASVRIKGLTVIESA